MLQPPLLCPYLVWVSPAVVLDHHSRSFSIYLGGVLTSFIGNWFRVFIEIEATVVFHLAVDAYWETAYVRKVVFPPHQRPLLYKKTGGNDHNTLSSSQIVAVNQN